MLLLAVVLIIVVSFKGCGKLVEAVGRVDLTADSQFLLDLGPSEPD